MYIHNACSCPECFNMDFYISFSYVLAVSFSSMVQVSSIFLYVSINSRY